MVRRQGRIAEHVVEQGSVAIKDLAEHFGVSLITMHRDLDELEPQGIIRKLRGYVTDEPSSLFDSSVRYRMRAAQREKEALARFAATQVEPGQSVLLDESTTALAVARTLPNKTPLTVITNFALVLNELSGVRGIDLIHLVANTCPSSRRSARSAGLRSRRCGPTSCSHPPPPSRIGSPCTRTRRPCRGSGP